MPLCVIHPFIHPIIQSFSFITSMANNNYYVCGGEEEFDNQISCEKKIDFFLKFLKWKSKKIKKWRIFSLEMFHTIAIKHSLIWLIEFIWTQKNIIFLIGNISNFISYFFHFLILKKETNKNETFLFGSMIHCKMMMTTTDINEKKNKMLSNAKRIQKKRLIHQMQVNKFDQSIDRSIELTRPHQFVNFKILSTKKKTMQ